MLDVNLSGRSSEPVANALAARRIPFAFSTGNTVSDLRDGFRDRPVLLRKPFRSEALANILSELFTPEDSGRADRQV